MTFDYENTETPDDVVRSVAAEMSGGRLKPLSDDERLQRKHWREELHQREQERKAEQEYRQLLADEAARQQEADERAENNRRAREKMRSEYIARQEQQNRNLDLSILRNEARQQGQWRNAVQGSIRQQQVQSLYGELEKMLAPPPGPEDTTEIVYVSEDDGSPELGTRNFNPALFNKKPRSWF